MSLDNEKADALPEPERGVFKLHWYGGLTLVEVATALGVSERTAKRYWQSARLRLFEALHGEFPEA